MIEAAPAPKPFNKRCPIPDHDNLPYITICCNPECEHRRLCCLKCLLHVHTECNEFMIRIEDV